MDIDSNENLLASNSSIYVNTNQTENENSDKSLLSMKMVKTVFSNQNFLNSENKRNHTLQLLIFSSVKQILNLDQQKNNNEVFNL